MKKSRLYQYVGSSAFIPAPDQFPPRLRLDDLDELKSWMVENRDQIDLEECIPATYIVDDVGHFWIADRGSEHVACARVGKVQAAGEVFFSGLEEVPYIDRITNQSTGYCPEASCWSAVLEAFEAINIPFPENFDPAFEFRNCESCGTLNLIKEDYFVCMCCGAELSENIMFSR